MVKGYYKPVDEYGHTGLSKDFEKYYWVKTYLIGHECNTSIEETRLDYWGKPADWEEFKS